MIPVRCGRCGKYHGCPPWWASWSLFPSSLPAVENTEVKKLRAEVAALKEALKIDEREMAELRQWLVDRTADRDAWRKWHGEWKEVAEVLIAEQNASRR